MNITDIKNQAKKLYKFDIRRNVLVEFLAFLTKFAAIFALGTAYIILVTKTRISLSSTPIAFLFALVLVPIYLLIVAPINLGRNLYFIRVADALQPATDEMFHFFRDLKSAIYAYFRIAVEVVFYTVIFLAVMIVYFRIYALTGAPWFTVINFLLVMVIFAFYAASILLVYFKYSLLPLVYHRHSPMSPIVFVAKTLRFSKGTKRNLLSFHLNFVPLYLLGIITLGIGFFWIRPYTRIAAGIYLKDRVK